MTIIALAHHESDDECPPQALMDGDDEWAARVGNVSLDRLTDETSSPNSRYEKLRKSMRNTVLTAADLQNLKRQCSSAPAVLTTQELEKLRRDQMPEALAELGFYASTHQAGHKAAALPSPCPLTPTSMEGMRKCNYQLQQLLVKQQQHIEQQEHQLEEHKQLLEQIALKDGGAVDSKKPKMAVEMTAPCCHNQWERISKKKNSISLRCRKCKACWKTKLGFFQKCPDFYSGSCPRGDECPHPHIYSRAAEKYLQQHNQGSEDHPETTSPGASSHTPQPEEHDNEDHSQVISPGVALNYLQHLKRDCENNPQGISSAIQTSQSSGLRPLQHKQDNEPQILPSGSFIQAPQYSVVKYVQQHNQNNEMLLEAVSPGASIPTPQFPSAKYLPQHKQTNEEYPQAFSSGASFHTPHFFTPVLQAPSQPCFQLVHPFPQATPIPAQVAAVPFGTIISAQPYFGSVTNMQQPLHPNTFIVSPMVP
ncbi:hypothetical protein DIPPA_00255 [Diplonema papillatum]|nr:hypothetical protein DIPPA_00255 [Diplonema papillatum]